MRRGGFTLIEVLVTTVLLAAVSAAVATLLGASLRVWGAGQDRADELQTTAAVLDTVTRDLRGGFLGRQGYCIARDGGDGVFYLELTTLAPRSERLRYLVDRGEETTANLADWAQVIYFTEPADDGETFALYRQEVCPPSPEPLNGEDLDPEQAQLLCDHATAFALRFWDATAQDWVSAWDTAAEGTTTTGLPAAAEVTIGLRQRTRDRTALARVPMTMGVIATATTTATTP
jgi:prepilin-type N-terminal cleavage/methylation domain-containing protein